MLETAFSTFRANLDDLPKSVQYSGGKTNKFALLVRDLAYTLLLGATSEYCRPVSISAAYFHFE